MAPLSLDLRQRVVAAVIAGESCRLVAVRFDVAAKTVALWTKRYRETGSVAPPEKTSGRRRPSRLDPHRDFIAARIGQTPRPTVRQLVDDLAGRGVATSYGAVWRFLRREGLLGRRHAA